MKNEIEKLRSGDDYPAREYLSQKMENLIERSRSGKIAIADFTEELKMLTIEGRMMMDTAFANNPNK